MNPRVSTLAERIQALDPVQIVEAQDFVDLLRPRSFDRGLLRDAATASNRAFGAVWNNPEDAAYDAL
jgi:hypothetical protein